MIKFLTNVSGFFCFVYRSSRSFHFEQDSRESCLRLQSFKGANPSKTAGSTSINSGFKVTKLAILTADNAKYDGYASGYVLLLSHRRIVL